MMTFEQYLNETSKKDKNKKYDDLEKVILNTIHSKLSKEIDNEDVVSMVINLQGIDVTLSFNDDDYFDKVKKVVSDIESTGKDKGFKVDVDYIYNDDKKAKKYNYDIKII